jgi:hypothetical protein
MHGPIFTVEQHVLGTWACVNLPRDEAYCREVDSVEEAQETLACLRKALAREPGPTRPRLQKWERGGFCGGRRGR